MCRGGEESVSSWILTSCQLHSFTAGEAGRGKVLLLNQRVRKLINA